MAFGVEFQVRGLVPAARYTLKYYPEQYFECMIPGVSIIHSLQQSSVTLLSGILSRPNL